MAHNHVAANLLMTALVVGGLLMGLSIKQEVFPEIALDMVQVSVAYPGAGPEEVEEGIVLKIEESLSGVNGVKEIKSVAGEGLGVVTAEVMRGEDVEQVLQDAKAEVDRITTFPQEAERPVITRLVNRSEVIYVAVYGDMPEKSLREYAEGISDDLLAMPQITQTGIFGVRPYEISIEVSEKSLQRYGLTLGAIAGRIRSASVDLPAGTIKTSGGEILIRTKEKRYRGYEYAGISILRNPDGSEVRLGDIAVVRDSFRETDEFSVFDGRPAALVAVYRLGDERPTVISRVVRDYVRKRQASLPPSVRISTLNDRSEMFQSRLDLLTRNAFFGLILVFIILGLFLHTSLALWVMLGIPISFLGAMVLMPGLDVSINMISLFAFILALGIVVDDAIVVGENVFEHRRRGKGYLRAAVDGACEVSGPVVVSVLTTIATFVPLVYIGGNIGKFIRTIPLVVIPILVVSLVESLFILPAHLGHGRAPGAAVSRPGPVERVRLGFGAALERFVSGTFLRALGFCAENRYSTLAAALAVLLVSVGLVGGGVVKFRFMPEVDGDYIIASLRMPIGTSVEKTAEVQRLIEERARETARRYDAARSDGSSILRHVYSIVGGTIRRGPLSEPGETGSNIAEVALILTPSETRGVPAVEIANRWRVSVGDVPGAESLSFDSNIVHFGANIDIRLAHNDFGVLRRAADRIKTALAAYPGVGDIADNYSTGKRELKLRLRPEASTLGITEADLAEQVRGAFYGAEALRFQRGRNEIRVMVRYPERERKSIADLKAMRIRTPRMGEVPFGRAAYVEQGMGYSAIHRSDRKRVVNITASVDSKVANAEEILAEIKTAQLRSLADDYPGLSYDLEGEEKERRESMGSMKKGFIMALFAIFALLAVEFRSYSQPLIVMAAIPFGIVGAILGHLIMGYDLSMLSLFGLVALSGVLVNDSLLLIDYINRKREDGLDARQCVLEAGRRRFRPILLTSLTTAFGLLPIMLETSVQAQFLIPMAISLGFGILFATAITLILIPSLYLILEDMRRFFGFAPSRAGSDEGQDGGEDALIPAE